jgi:hypothetical protein
MVAKKKPTQRFCVVRSESCDYYVIPADKQDHFEEWSLAEDGSDPPEYTHLIDGGTLTFTDWKIER